MFVFNLITIVTAITFIQFSTQKPYQRFDVEQEPYKRPNYQKPWNYRRVLTSLDSYVPDEISNRVILKSGPVKRRESSGKRQNNVRQIVQNTKRALNDPSIESVHKVQPSLRNDQSGGWIKWNGKTKLTQVNVAVDGQLVFAHDMNKGSGNYNSVDVDVHNNPNRQPFKEHGYVNQYEKHMYEDDNGNRYYRITNEYILEDGHLQPVYEDDYGKRFYRHMNNYKFDNRYHEPAFVDIYGNKYYRPTKRYTRPTRQYTSTNQDVRPTKQYNSYNEDERPTRQHNSYKQDVRPTRQYTSNNKDGRATKQYTSNNREIQPTKQYIANKQGVRPTKQYTTNNQEIRPTRQNTSYGRKVRPTKQYTSNNLDFRPLKQSISGNLNQNSVEEDVSDNLRENNIKYGTYVAPDTDQLPHEFHFKR